MQDLFERSQASKGVAGFSGEESSRFKTAFESKEFRDMFSQYLEEIQDPSARRENEEYIAQLEKEDKVVKPYSSSTSLL